MGVKEDVDLQSELCIRYRMKYIPGYEGVYTVSPEGEIFNSDGKSRKFGIHRGGYRQITLFRKDKTTEIKYVHRVVAEAYLPNPEGLPVVNHIDGDRANNRVENLEWTTQGDNIRKAMAKRGNWLARAPRRKVAVVSVSAEEDKTEVQHASIRAAVDWLNTQRASMRGSQVTYKQACSGISKSSRDGSYCWGYFWYRPGKRVEFKKRRPRTPPKPKMPGNYIDLGDWLIG